MLRNKIIFSLLGITGLVGVTIAGSGIVNAQDVADKPQSVIQRIAQKFNLNESDVKAVFDEDHQVRQAQMKASLEQKLTQAVKEGKINEAQKTAILNKFSEMKEGFVSGQFRDMTAAQRKEVMQQKKIELENLGKENGLTVETLRSLIGYGSKGFGMRGLR